MIYLLMRFQGDKPAFTGMAFARQSMADSVAIHKNGEKNGYHYTQEVAVDTSSDHDDCDEMPEGHDTVHVILFKEDGADLCLGVYTDASAAAMVTEAKGIYNEDVQYRIEEVKLIYSCPPEERGEDPNAVIA